jgi:catechol 2,3-dioxygenase-like lactoylglutathione lyase family enzyme
MPEFREILYSVEDHILTITFNRPDALNAMTNTLYREFMTALDLAEADDEIRAIIVTGAGRAFCAGAALGGTDDETCFIPDAYSGNGGRIDGRGIDWRDWATRDRGGMLTLRLFEHMEQIGYATGFDSPDWVVPKELRATPAPLFLNHVGITVPNPKQTVDFLTQHLGFYVSEKIVSDNGRQLLSALLFRMTKDVGGQELAIYPGEAGRLHQIAFTKEDANDILIDGQYLRNDRIDIDQYGPTRQSYGKTFSLHFYDPFGVRLELCSGGRITDPHPDFEPVVWTESNLKKALSYYDRDLNPRFLEPCL